MWLLINASRFFGYLSKLVNTLIPIHVMGDSTCKLVFLSIDDDTWFFQSVKRTNKRYSELKVNRKRTHDPA